MLDNTGNTRGVYAAPAQLTTDDIKDLIRAGASDADLFYRTFFPRTMRQASPPFHREMDVALDGTRRYINIQIFRGGAKTSRARMYTARRIAYGIARTILYVGKSEGHAIRSISWLRRQIEHNRLYASAFSLRPGSKWQDFESEIWHGTDEYPIWIMGMGITGSIRGINRDDFRPDLIILDDVADEENSATDDQRKKMNDLIYGAVRESLAPVADAPDAKMIITQTPMHKEDVSTLALNDPEWLSLRFGCWTKETENAPLAVRESSWPERYPSETLREEKLAAAARNQISIFTREKECKLTAPETSAFLPKWLKFYELLPLEHMFCVMVIDPVPPPSDIQIAKGLHNKDYEALAVVGKFRKDIYLLDYEMRRGHEPDWTIAMFHQLAEKWRPIKVLVEATAYQRTLAWLLKQSMNDARRWWPIKEFDDKRKKFNKIVDGLNGIASAGHLHVRSVHTDFISQFSDYPDVAHDDLLEAVAIGATELRKLEGMDEDYDMEGTYTDVTEKDIPALSYTRGAP